MAKNEANPESEVAKFVRNARASMGLIQEDFAYKFNCTKGNVSAWEQGRHEPAFAVLCAISAESNVPLPVGAKPDFFPANTSVIHSPGKAHEAAAQPQDMPQPPTGRITPMGEAVGALFDLIPEDQIDRRRNVMEALSRLIRGHGEQSPAIPASKLDHQKP